MVIMYPHKNMPIHLSFKAKEWYVSRQLTYFLIFILVTHVILALPGCQQEIENQDEKMLTVAVSIPPQAWLVEQIAGDHVNVITMIQPGESPTTFQPTDVQISQLARATVFIRIGVPFENGAWFRNIVRTNQFKIIDARQGITLRSMEHVHHDDHDETNVEHVHTEYDPHIWLSPKLLKIQAQAITTELCKLDPPHAEIYRRNRSELEKKIDETNTVILSILKSIPQRTFFVFHPAWGYFADEYDLEQIAIEIQGKSSSDSELTQLQQRARQLQIKVIFVQPQISSRAAEVIATAIDGQVEYLDPLAPNVLDNLVSVAKKIAESYEPK